jgi:hypothetical protein
VAEWLVTGRQAVAEPVQTADLTVNEMQHPAVLKITRIKQA